MVKFTHVTDFVHYKCETADPSLQTRGRSENIHRSILYILFDLPKFIEKYNQLKTKWKEENLLKASRLHQQVL